MGKKVTELRRLQYEQGLVASDCRAGDGSSEVSMTLSDHSKSRTQCESKHGKEIKIISRSIDFAKFKMIKSRSDGTL
jgi:hypothetical protein